MKIKQHIYLTDLSNFLRGDYNCFSMLSYLSPSTGWLPVAEIYVDVDLDKNGLRQKLIDEIDEEIETIREGVTQKLQQLEQGKQQLLALIHNPEEVS